MAEYIAAIFEHGEMFDVVFPDFPGCVTQGENLDDAKAMAEEALALHVRGMAEDGEAIPRPMGLRAAKQCELCKDADAFIFVKRQPLSRHVRVNITIPEDQLDRIDAYAKAHGYTRSGMLLKGAQEIVERGRQ